MNGTLGTMARPKKPASEQTAYTTFKIPADLASMVRELAAIESTLKGKTIEQGKLLDEILRPMLTARLTEAMQRRQKQLGKRD